MSQSGEYLVEPKPAPNLNIPFSDATVSVSIIDTSTRVTIPMGVMTKPIVGGYEDVTCPAYSFLITHPPTGRKLLFDLGVRKDFDNGPASIVDRVKEAGWGVEAPTDAAEILEDHGVALKGIEGIVWSHYHWDHTGDPSKFPDNTALIVGPGFKGRWSKGYPSDPEAKVHEGAWEGRELREISFESSGGLTVGRFKAFDYFGDGSFYLLDTPGHLLGHMCGLARTTRDSFIFMGGDAAHHAGEIRPTEWRPLPSEVKLDGPLPQGFPCPCPGELLQHHIHPDRSATMPFYKAAEGFNEVPEQADWSIDGLTEFDADDRVLVVVAHDATLLSVLDFFPKSADDWRSKEWGREGRWRFLADFSQGVTKALEAT